MDLISELQHDIDAARDSGNTRYANRLQSILDTDDPAQALKRAHDGGFRPDELAPFMEMLPDSDTPTASVEMRNGFAQEVEDAVQAGDDERLKALEREAITAGAATPEDALSQEVKAAVAQGDDARLAELEQQAAENRL
jgi:hypothetical protein